MFRSSNPTLKEGLFSDSGILADGQVMTVQGAVNKTLVLLFLLAAGAAWVWQGVTPFLSQAALATEGSIIFCGQFTRCQTENHFGSALIWRHWSSDIVARRLMQMGTGL